MMTHELEIEKNTWNPYTLQHGWRAYTEQENPFTLGVQEPVDLYWNNGQKTVASTTANRWMLPCVLFWRISKAA